MMIWRTYAEVRSELELLKDEVLLQEKTSEGFASREEKCRVEVELKKHQEKFHLLNMCNDECIDADHVIIQEVLAKLDMLEPAWSPLLDSRSTSQLKNHLKSPISCPTLMTIDVLFAIFSPRLARMNNHGLQSFGPFKLF